MTPSMRRIATEEAFCLPEVVAALREVARGPSSSLDKILCKGIYDPRPEDGYSKSNWLEGLLDIEGQRLKQMDELACGHAPALAHRAGVQMFDADTATELAARANDTLAEVCRKHPSRFAGLAAMAPQSPKRAAREMERAIQKLGLNRLHSQQPHQQRVPG